MPPPIAAVEAYKADMEKAVDAMLERGVICILSTIPPHLGKPELAKQLQRGLRQLAKARELPLIDYEKEIQ